MFLAKFVETLNAYSAISKRSYRFLGRPLTHERWWRKILMSWLRLNEPINSEFKSSGLTLVLPNDQHASSIVARYFAWECLRRNFGILVDLWLCIFFRSSEVTFNFLTVRLESMLIMNWDRRKRISVKISFHWTKKKYIYIYISFSSFFFYYWRKAISTCKYFEITRIFQEKAAKKIRGR